MRGLMASVVLVAAASSAAEIPRRIPVAEIFANPALSAPELSDDGKTFAYIYSQGALQLILSHGESGGEPVASRITVAGAGTGST